MKKPAKKAKPIPASVLNLLAGAVIEWTDETPLSDAAEEALLYSFNTNTTATTDLLLRKHGMWDVSHIVNYRLRWLFTITVEFKTPKKGAGMYRQENHTFELHATIFPQSQKFKIERDKHYLACRLHNLQIPHDKKAWGIYTITRFKAVCLGA